MISVQALGTSRPDSSSGWVHCVVFLDSTLYSHSVSIHPGVSRNTSKLSQQPDKLLLLRGACYTASRIYLRYGFALPAAEIYHLLTDCEGRTTTRFNHVEDSGLKLRKMGRVFQILPLCLGEIAKSLLLWKLPCQACFGRRFLVII